jgi:hypothetical protein
LVLRAGGREQKAGIQTGAGAFYAKIFIQRCQEKMQGFEHCGGLNKYRSHFNSGKYKETMVPIRRYSTTSWLHLYFFYRRLHRRLFILKPSGLLLLSF